MGLIGPSFSGTSMLPPRAIPLPDQQRVALVIGLVFPLLSLVLAPGGAHLDRLRLGIHAEAHAERRRQMGAGHGSIGIGLAVVRRVAAPFGEFVGDQRNLFVLVAVIVARAGCNSRLAGPPAGRRTAERSGLSCAVRSVVPFPLAPRRPQQIPEDHRFQFGSIAGIEGVESLGASLIIHRL